MKENESKDLLLILKLVLTKIHKIKWWVLAAFAAYPVILLVLIASSTIQSATNLIVEQLTNNFLVQIGLIALFLLFFKCVEFTTAKLKNRVAPFKKLNVQQQQYLLQIYQTGSPRVKVHQNTSRMQWFRELEVKNYMKHVSLPILIGGDPYSIYYVSSKGWKKIENYKNSTNS